MSGPRVFTQIEEFSDLKTHHAELSEFLYYVDPVFTGLEHSVDDILRLSADADHLDIKVCDVELKVFTLPVCLLIAIQHSVFFFFWIGCCPKMFAVHV